jgi:hypothetical protein
MDWNRAAEENIRTLRRIAALLLAVAGLADRAAVRSRPVRHLVLWLLRPAEDVARDYVARLAGASFTSQPSATLADDSADAMRLAQSFRALAAVLAALAAAASASRQGGARVSVFSLAFGASTSLAALRGWPRLTESLDSS